MFKKMIENSEGYNTSLNLNDKNLGDDDVKSLAEALESSHITQLDLSNSNIRFNGLKYLADVLKNTKITYLNLTHTNLQNESVKYLAKVLSETEIISLDLSENKISFEAAEYLNGMMSGTNIKSLYLDVYYTENGSEYISQRSLCQYNFIEIEINDSKIGKAGSRYLNRSFFKTGIHQVRFHISDCNEDDVHDLAQAFKNINITILHLLPHQLTEYFNVGYLSRIFERSRINRLYLGYTKSWNYNVECLADFLKKVKILDLQLDYNYLSDESVKILTQAIKNSEIMNLSLSGNHSISSEGAKYLSEILRDSKIIELNLCNCCIGIVGAKYLANGLPNSQVTNINLHNNGIGFEGYQALIDVVDDTNIEWVNLHRNGIEKGMDDGEKLWPYSLPRETTTIAHKIQKAFGELVSFDSNGDLEFKVLTKDIDCYPPMDIDDYAFLISTLINNPNSKVHLIYKMCRKENGFYDFSIHGKIDEFINSITNKFISFLNNNLFELLAKFPDSDNVDFVRQFEESKLHDIVQNLLFHRVLYYVDENQEILHPYIYKLFNQYNLPMYKSELEPNKKNVIISYFESHPEIEGVQEIVDLLKSNSI